MKRLALLAALALSACTSVVTPKIDDLTGTTLEQRCVDYIATVRAYDAVSVSRVLDPWESAAVMGAKLFLANKCASVVAS